MNLDGILAKALECPRNLTAEELAFLVDLRDPSDQRAVRAAAYALKLRRIGPVVSLRGLVEVSNICAKDCLYCGIRQSNGTIGRYRLSLEEVDRLGAKIREFGYASVVLQGGEIESEANTVFIEECIRRLAQYDLGVTLSLGEQDDSVYRRWKSAGAVRYLLRIETSSPKLYALLHPATHSFSRRVACLKALRRYGYQVGTGVMSALPGQTAEDLANDILFFGEIDADMIGMGPYIPHPRTPLAETAPALASSERLRLGLNMIAATRLYLHDVNIASTTALQSLADDGREQGLLAGANVIMPNVTEVGYRAYYQLYAGKPVGDENAERVRAELDARLASIGERAGYGRRGDSPHFARRTEETSYR